MTDLEDIPEGDRIDAVADADVLLSLSPGQELADEGFHRLDGRQTIQLVTAGADHVPFERLPDGMDVLGNAGAYAEPMAEHALALYLALAKRLPIEHHNMQDGEFNQFRTNRRVDGSVCAIYGFGATGEAAARLMKPLGVEIHAINRSGEADESIAFLGTPADFDTVLERCDGLVIAAPLTTETRGRIGRDELERMADDAFLVNVSRGEIVDQQALYEHLVSNPGFQAGLESWWIEPVRHGAFELEYPFLELPNVLACPHNAAMVPGALEGGIRQAAENVRRTLAGEPANVVDRDLYR